MIFQASEASLILARRKTEVCVPVGPHPFRAGELERRCRYRPGRTYRLAVAREWTAKRLAEHRALVEAEHPGNPVRALLAFLDAPLDASVPDAAGREITVLEVRRLRLGDMPASAIRREGFKFAADFYSHYLNEHGLDRGEIVWVVAFVLDDESARFDPPRLLAARPGPGHDYVSGRGARQAMRGEPEALTAEQLSHLSAGSRQRWLADQAALAQRIAGQSLAERMGAVSRGRVVTPDS